MATVKSEGYTALDFLQVSGTKKLGCSNLLVCVGDGNNLTIQDAIDKGIITASSHLKVNSSPGDEEGAYEDINEYMMNIKRTETSDAHIYLTVLDDTSPSAYDNTPPHNAVTERHETSPSMHDNSCTPQNNALSEFSHVKVSALEDDEHQGTQCCCLPGRICVVLVSVVAVLLLVLYFVGVFGTEAVPVFDTEADSDTNIGGTTEADSDTNIGAFFYVFGGGYPRQRQTDKYSISDNNEITFVSRNADLPMDVWGHTASAVKDGMIYLVGEKFMTARYTSVVYSSSNNTFRLLPDHARTYQYQPCVFIIGCMFYVMGGSWQDESMDYLNICTDSSEWEVNDITFPFYSFLPHAITIGNIVYVIARGASSGSLGYKSLFSWSPGDSTLNQLADMQQGRDYHDYPCVVTDSSKIWIIGGCEYTCVINDMILASMEVYDPLTDIWEFKESLPLPLYGMACFHHNGFIVVTGGVENDNNRVNTIYIYNIQANTWQLSPSTLAESDSDQVAVVIS